MNVLFVSPYPPYPATFGGSQRIFHLMREAARSHRVFSLTFASTLGEPVDRAPYEALCQEIVEVPRPDENKRALQLRSLVSPRSYQLLSHTSPAMQAALDDLVRREFIDLVVLEFSQMTGLVVPPGPAVVVDEHNVEWDLLARAAETSRGWLRRSYTKRESLRFRAEERAGLARADRVTVTSDRDREMLLADDPGLAIDVVPNGVDTEAFAPAPGPGSPGTLVFAGAMHYGPNLEGALHFIQEILPLIRAQEPDVRFIAAGGKVAPELAALTGDGVEATGYVDDIQPWFRKAAVFVVPLLAGGGTRFKVVEALSIQRPVVSTSLGAEGLDVEHDRHLLLADTPEAFAAATVALLRDRDRAERLAAEGRRLVERRYAWSAVGRLQEQAWQAALETPAPVRPVTERKLRSVLQ